MKKQVLIVGASGGIGEALAAKFASEGFDLHLQGFSNEDKLKKLEEALKIYDVNCHLYIADMTSSADVKNMFDQIIQTSRKIDVMIYSAGHSEQQLFQWISDEAWDKMLAVNLTGNFYCCREAIAHMVSQKEGVILNLSSIWGMCGAAMEVHYSAAKAGVIGMTKALAKEVGPSGVRVNCLAPGWVLTPMNAGHDEETKTAFAEESALGRVGTAEEIAEWAHFLCSDKASFMTGQVVSPNGGAVI